MSSAGARDGAFNTRVQAHFGRQAGAYDSHARLQQGVAWRLAHLCRSLPLPTGPRADLGAGSGLVGQALRRQGEPEPLPHMEPLLQVDQCVELLGRNPLAKGEGALLWDLNRGLPEPLQQAALLTSSFALQWLDEPARQLELWCQGLRPGGWLALAVPTASSFPQWHQAAAAAGVPCTALPLPPSTALVAAARRGGLAVKQSRVLRFSRSYGSGLGFLHQLQRLGADASRSRPLTAAALRHLLHHWPGDGIVSWDVLLLLGQRPHP